ncbi:DUF6527 family protein [Sagittula salina]|uniref:Ammonia monooxygenase n=1 Tax=Sagittula salina TaxID=2820268 RepID=A0A940MSP1_9RHOB|nr:DUF6527 family protein [Sagittula salina]MBP0484689.1 ammonia monooxygenase [Sagittula salina]
MARVIHRGSMLQVVCPCGHEHHLNLDPGKHPCWSWNEDLHRPTVTPSINAAILAADGVTVRRRCHSYIMGGRVQFLADCTHALAGQTLDLPEVAA